MTAKAGARKTSRASTLQAAKPPEREIMEHYKNFQLAGYVWAYWLDRVGEDEIRESIETLTKKMPLKKVYLENHRGLVDVPQVKMRVAKKVFEEYGIETAGGITTTVLEGERKSAILDSFCYTDPRHRERLLGVVRELAEVFDEIILDDYFFTSCRCEMCIKAKGSKSWAQYRTELMSEFSEEMVGLAHEINPGLKFVIKYPNWYESYQENGYDPKRQKDIFDGVYTGTESRTPFFNAQHLQSYMSYSNIRLFENTAPGRNGGGWIDPGGSAGNATVFVDQAEMTFLAGAKELALFNYEMMLRDTALAVLLGEKLYRTDRIMGQAGTPVGVSAYEAFDGDGEDQFYNFLGMRGIPVEPQPFFNDKAPAVLLTQSSCIDKDVVKKVEKYVREGGTVIMTSGFFREEYENGVKDFTSVRLTSRHVCGGDYVINNRNYTFGQVVKGGEPVMFEVMQYKTNATWPDVMMAKDEHSFPIFTEDQYGKGRVFIFNVPENFADLYKLPQEVMENIAKHLTTGLPLYVSSRSKVSLMAYDNGLYVLRNWDTGGAAVKVIVRGNVYGNDETMWYDAEQTPADYDPGCPAALVDAETGQKITYFEELPRPSRHFDCTTIIPEPLEFAATVNMFGGAMKVFRIEK